MAEHSPGPWRWVDHNAVELYLDDADGKTVLCFWTSEGRVPSEADARLLAAAPEMLKLLRYVAERGEGGAYEARTLIARICGQ